MEQTRRGESFSGTMGPGRSLLPLTGSPTSASLTVAAQTVRTFCPWLRWFCARRRLLSAAATEFQLWILESATIPARLSFKKLHWSSAWSSHQFGERCSSPLFWSGQWTQGTVAFAAAPSAECDPFGASSHSSRSLAFLSSFQWACYRLTASDQHFWCAATSLLSFSCRFWSLLSSSRPLWPCCEALCHAARECRQSSPHGTKAYLQAGPL